jgi:hypothetical protein
MNYGTTELRNSISLSQFPSFPQRLISSRFAFCIGLLFVFTSSIAKGSVDPLEIVFNINLDPSGDGAGIGSVHFHGKVLVSNDSTATAVHDLIVKFADGTQTLLSSKTLTPLASALLEGALDDVNMATNPPTNLIVKKFTFDGAVATLVDLNFGLIPSRDVFVPYSAWTVVGQSAVLSSEIYCVFRQNMNIPETNRMMAIINENATQPIPQSYPVGGAIMWSMPWAEGSFGHIKQTQLNTPSHVADDMIATSIGTIHWNELDSRFYPDFEEVSTIYSYVSP